ncbi:MAG: hypothetical protein K2X47_16775, partial [Bdellovibrionales bacterium]|nr:hypothetical protein [Bdellovibrionales bacterium]
TAMAVPTFNRMLAKSRQGQAKAELSGLYTSMKAFFGEHTTYTTRFDSIGYRPEGELNYVIGFAGDVLPPANAYSPGTATCIRTETVAGTVPTAGQCMTNYTVSWASTIRSSSAMTVGFPGPGVTAQAAPAAQNYFTAWAIGAIESLPAAMTLNFVDSWSINEQKLLINIPRPSNL